MTEIRPETNSPAEARRSRAAVALAVVGALLVLAAAGVVIWTSVTTSTARLSASTGGSGFFAAGSVDLAQPERAVSLLFDADGLYPGQIVTSCVLVSYDGTIRADVRLHASVTGGTGLERFVEVRFRTMSSPTASCPEEGRAASTGPAGQPVFAGLLAALAEAHGTYASGVLLLDAAEPGDRMVLLAEAELVGGDELQGLTTDFAIVIEARP